ncbi:hypothetical protein P879_06805 [Paragonimus westermani]|uniref:Golgi apparatus protein 1 n=1 Tax=Paragonimus westermani TaxID=34504 RepID=A0A8T0D3P6_9TREM|nr:hypothetical protein P879_06805 [Paragonimus westermani]
MSWFWFLCWLTLFSAAPATSGTAPKFTATQNTTLTPLALSEECKQDVATHCARHAGSDWSTIACLQQDEKTLNAVSEKCQNLVWQRKLLITMKGPFEASVPEQCLQEFRNIRECQPLANSAAYVSCLASFKKMIKGPTCIAHLNEAAAFIFSDFRLVYKFIHSCENDIRKYECGRIEIGPYSPAQELQQLAVTSQGKTIHCLQARVEKLEDDCRRQIFHLTELQSDDYHLDRPLYYACREDRERLCPNVESGRGLVYACLKDHKYHPEMSPGCRKMISQRQKLRALDFFIDFRLARACAADIEQAACQAGDQNKPDLTSSRMMLCLEAVEKPQITGDNTVQAPGHLQPECRSELGKLRREMLDDYRLSPDLMLHCDATIERHCGSKKHGRGTMLHCLLHQFRSYTTERPPPECENAVHALLKATNVEENAILDPVIDRACHGMLATKCAGLEKEGHGALFECLSTNQLHPSMTTACRTHLLELLYFVTRDVTLDDHLHRACAEDSLQFCNLPKIVWNNYNRPDAHLLTCLYNHRRLAPASINRTGVLSEKCHTEVMRLVHVRAASVALDPRVFQVCLADLASCNEEDGEEEEEDFEEDEDFPEEIELFAGSRSRGLMKQARPVPRLPVKKRKEGSSGLLCLQQRLETLQPDCRAAVVQVSEEAQEDPNLDKLIAEACVSAETRFCSGYVNPGEVLNCLIRHKNHPEMADACRAAVEHMQVVALKDLQISNRFRKSCSSDAQKYCKQEITRGTAAVVVCLSAQLTAYRLFEAKRLAASDPRPSLPPLSAACHHELVSQLYERSESIALDPELADACETDRKRFCSEVMPGDGRILQCLHEHRLQLSSECHRKLFVRDQLMAIENQADYPLFRACGRMIEVHCASVIARLAEMADTINEQAGNHAILECLTAAVDRDRRTRGTFDPVCRQHLWDVMELRAKDYRLDPELQQLCASDIDKYCQAEAEATLKSPYEQNGPVLRCLKKRFVERKLSDKMLSMKCYARVRQLIQWERAAPHLDPVLARACKADLMRNCGHQLNASTDMAVDRMDQGVRECLQTSLKSGTIYEKGCIDEIVQLIEEVKSDLHVDPVLHRACALEVQQICGEIEPGQGRQMTCLLRVLERSDAAHALGQACLTQLTKRRELWNHVAKLQRPDSLEELVYQVSASRSRNYILLALFIFFSFVFVFGLCCGRVTTRVPVDVKTK